MQRHGKGGRMDQRERAGDKAGSVRGRLQVVDSSGEVRARVGAQHRSRVAIARRGRWGGQDGIWRWSLGWDDDAWAMCDGSQSVASRSSGLGRRSVGGVVGG